MKKSAQVQRIMEKVLDIWADNCNGMYHPFIDLKTGRTGIKLEAPGDSWEYDSIEDAVEDCLYGIGEWLKEVQR